MTYADFLATKQTRHVPTGMTEIPEMSAHLFPFQRDIVKWALQLDVIERAMKLWSNPGDIVLSPFAGIGSEGFMALKMGRRFVGCELKGSYFKQACSNLRAAASESHGGLFSKDGEVA